MNRPVATTRHYALLLGAMLVGLAAAVAATSLWARAGLRRQVLEREANALQALTAWQRELETERIADLGLDASDRELALLVLAVARLPEVLGVQAFERDGRPRAGQVGLLPIPAPTDRDWSGLAAGRPLARLQAGQPPLLDVLVPLTGDESGAVRFALDATRIRRELRALDRRIAAQALLVWLVAGAVLAGALAVTHRRLRRAEAELLAQAASLQAANRDLTFAAKTSAIGALAAHLVHGLRNPIAGLESLARVEPAEAAESLREASAAARRMRELVNEVVALLRDSPDAAAQPVPAREVLDEVARGVAETARRHGTALTVETAASLPAVAPRAAGVAGAILRNLARNACEAAGAGGQVVLRAEAAGDAVEFSVTDDGPGLAPSVAGRLFEPVPSTKPDGAGIGLAISRHLAMGLGAVLEAEPAPSRGTRFRLRLPPSA